jgi:ubiquinone/menaquinone biosynthesis C-methylase UbiE
MSSAADQQYLLNEQYRNASNLNARIELHRRFSTNSYGWHRWVFDHFRLPPDARVLELGCGPGELWRENGDRIPEGWEVTLADLSPGMLEAGRRVLAAKRTAPGPGPGRQSLRDLPRSFAFAEVDAQAIPFPDASFDGVIANHMLYHVPDREKAFAEIRRVLRPGGRLYAATNGQAHMRELREWVQRWTPNASVWSITFDLENGREQLARWFAGVTLRRYEDALVITEAEPLIAYVRSGYAGSAFAGDRLAELTAFIEREIASRGTIRITKDAGLFEAWGDR